MSDTVPVAEEHDEHEELAQSETAGAEPARATRRNKLLTGLTVTALYTAISVFCWQHLVAAGISDHMHRLNLGDVGQGVWFMGWLPFAIGHHINPFVSTYMLAPHGFNLLTNTNFFLQATILSPVTAIWSPLVSFNIACIAAPVVSAGSLYYVLRRYGMRRSVAFVGGAAYGLSPAVMQAARIGHFNLSWMFFPPLAAYLIDRILFRQTGRPVKLGLALGLLVVAQFFSSPEILLDGVVVALPVIVIAAAANPKKIKGHASFALAGSVTALLTAGTLLAYPLWFYVSGPRHVAYVSSGVGRGAAISSLVWPSVPTGHGFLVAPAGTPWVQRFDVGFVGPVLVILALGALALARRHRIVLLLWAATLWCIVLSWGSATRWSGTTSVFGWHAPAWYLARVAPILRNVTWIRLSILTTFLLALLASMALDALLSSFQSAGERWRHVVDGLIASTLGALVVIPLLVASNVPFASFESVRVPNVLHQLTLAKGRDAPEALVYPSGGLYDGTPLAWQAMAGFPYEDYSGYAWHPAASKPIGVVGPVPTVLVFLSVKAGATSPRIVLSGAQRRLFRAAFRQEHVTVAVVVEGHGGAQQLTRIYDQLFGKGHRVSDGEIWSTRRTA